MLRKLHGVQRPTIQRAEVASDAMDRMCASLAEKLAPCAQLVQSALTYFEERGIRHESDTYRPLCMSVTSLRVLVDRLVEARGLDGGGGDEVCRGRCLRSVSSPADGISTQRMAQARSPPQSPLRQRRRKFCAEQMHLRSCMLTLRQ